MVVDKRFEKKRVGRPKGSRTKKKVIYASPWDEFREHMRIAALDSRAPAALKSAYRDMLKIDVTMKKGWEISADELTKRNLEAYRQLREEGYLREGKMVI